MIQLKHIKFYTAFLLALITQGILAQVTFKTVVSKSELGVNQRFRIEFTIDKQGADNFKEPSFNDFKVVGGPSSSVNQSWINGKSSYSQSYIYILQPKKEGAFTIQPATITYKGKQIKSNSVNIKVTKAVAIPKDPNNPQYVAQQGIHLVTEISNTNPYIGEGVYVVYKLYVAPNINIYDYNIVESPQYVGFWNQNINISKLEGKRSTYKGKPYNQFVFKKAVLVPQKLGKLTIPAMKIDFSVGIPTGRGDFFGNMITKNTMYSAQSPIRMVRVKSLPKKGQPEGFSGAVGEFDFSVTPNKKSKEVNEASQIKVQISGKGNLKLIELPKLITPPELEVYTPEHKENLQTSITGSKGSISDLYTVVPQYRGKYKIPKVSFSYFNPKTRTYKTITSNEIIMDITEGKEVVTTPSGTTKKEVVASNANFKYIALQTKFDSKKTTDFFKSKWFYLFLALPFLVIPIVIFLKRRQELKAGDIVGSRIRKADKLARKYLSEAKKQLGKKEAFYIALEKALHNFLKAKLQVETTDISKEKITELLQNKKVDNTTINDFIEVLKDCEFARYTPSSDVEMKQEYEKAKNIIAIIDRLV